MADEADHAQELEQLALDHALAARRPGVRLAPRGFCHNCNGPVEAPRIFCDKDCADDYESLQRAKSQRRV